MAAKKNSVHKESPSDEDLDSGAEQISRTNPGYAKVAGLFGIGIPGSLYGV